MVGMRVRQAAVTANDVPRALGEVRRNARNRETGTSVSDLDYSACGGKLRAGEHDDANSLLQLRIDVMLRV